MKTVKKYSPKTKILSLILSFLIIFYLIPTSVFAEGLDNDITVSNNSVSENEGSVTYNTEIYEVTELREENVKHFRLEDGSYVAAQYNYPVHYTDENGQLIDIDNRLTESGSELSTGNSRIKFVKKITGNGNIFTLHENNTKITMGLAGAEKKTKGIAINNNNSDDAIESTIGKMVNLENISSTILYEDILDGVDIEYIVHSLNIKENIIVKEKKDSYCYSFTIELNNLTAALADDENVYISSLDGVRQYIIPAPIVYDANGIYAPDSVAEYSLSTTGNGKYVLIVTVNTAWMNDGTRAFPVIIDPPMLSTGAGTLDLNIDSSAPNTNTNGSESFYVSSSERAYLKFNEDYLADIPIGASIMKAELNIIGSSNSDESAKVGVYAITTPWDSTLTWNKTVAGTPQGSFSTTVLDYVFLNSGNRRQNWNITELYKSWLNGAPNYGVGLKLVDETSNESASFTACEYCSPDDDVNFYEPAIMVTYVYNDGLEDYYPTTTHSAGIGGVGSINLSTGRLTLAIPTLTTTDYLFSFTPTLVYNSSLAGKSATRENVSSAFSTSYMPYGFKLNIQETIVERSYTDADGASRTYYLLYDSDGSTHGFYRKTFTGPYYDNDGLRLTLTKETNGITIEDVNHNVKTYSSVSGGWHLTSVTDNSGNQLIFEFNSSNQPNKVILKPNGLNNIQMLSLLYEGNKLCAVYNDASKDSVILRYSNGNLAMLQYCYGNESTTEQNVRDTYMNSPLAANVTVYATVNYTYNSNGYITKITDSDANKSIQYAITGGKVSMISEYAETTLGQQISYTYGDGYTDVCSTGNDETLNTEDDIITRHVFDDYGRAVSAYSMSFGGTEIYGATTGTYETQENIKNNLQKQVVIGGSVVNYLLNGGFENGTNYWIVVGTSSLERDSQFEGEGRYCLEATPTPSVASIIKQHLRLRNGSYTLSMLVNSKNCTNYTGIAKIVYAGTSNVLHSEEIPLLTKSNFGEVSYFTTSFEINSTSEFTAVDVVIEFSTTQVNSDAKIQIDRVMLDNHIGSADYSLVKYGSFDPTTLNANSLEYSMQNIWTSDPIIVSNEAPFYNALKLTSSGVTSEKVITQRVFEAPAQDLIDYDNLYNNGNNNAYEYILSGFAKSENALSSSNSKFRLVVEIAYYQGAGYDDVVRTYEFDFIPGCRDWQFICGHIQTIPENPGSLNYDCIRYIDVKCEYSGQPEGYALFDNISLIYATGDNLAKYYYNAEGLLICTNSYGLDEYYHYDDNNCVTMLINNRGEFTEYKYEHTNPTLETSVTKYSYEWSNEDVAGDYFNPTFMDIVTETKVSSTEYTYNSYGLCTSMKLRQYDSNGNQLEEYIGENYHYITGSTSKIFGAMDYSIDSLRNQTSYVYDNANGRLLITGYADGSAVSYDYDESGRLIKALPSYYTYSTNTEVRSSSSNVEYTYNDRNLLEKIITDSTEYYIRYNTYNEVNVIYIGGYPVVSYEYYPNNGKLKRISYGTNFSEEYVYNDLDMLSQIWYADLWDNKILVYEYEYTSYGQLNKIIDHKSGRTTVFRYDVNDRIIFSGVYDDGEYELLTEYSYDELSRPSASSIRFRYYVGGVENTELFNYSYTYNSDNSLKSMGAFGAGIHYSYDNLNRLTGKTVQYAASSSGYTYSNEVTYGYKNVLECGSYYVDEYMSKVNGTTTSSFTYEYDSVGNITKITDKDGYEVRYYYAQLDVLARVEDEKTDKKYVYRYDSAGNITAIETRTLSAEDDGGGGGGDDDDFGTIYALQPLSGQSTSNVINLTYSSSQWGDLLASYDGVAITYRPTGYPTSYYNGTSYSFSWEGRQLIKAVTDSKTITFTYNDEGLRTSKTVNGSTTTYYYEGSTLVAERTPTYTCVYMHDESGSIIGAKYIGTSSDSMWQTFFFEKNLQGDVIAVYSSSGTKLFTYRYDAWGNKSIIYYIAGVDSIAANNPITYRGYYFDSDLGMYYLQSRYYDPNTCRFINADSYISTGQGLTSYNMFAYCGNNPVTRIDPTGKLFEYNINFEDDFCLEGAGSGGFGASGNYFGYGTAYYNHSVNSNVASYNAGLCGYYFGGGSYIGGSTAQYAIGTVSVDDSMAVNRGASQTTSNSLDTTTIHGNSLQSTKTNYGYALVDSSRNILKFGETINPATRYSKAYLSKNNATMVILTSGSKIDIHLWQHDMNEYYYYRYGVYPPLNQKGW